MFKLFLVSAIAYSANGIDVPITSDEWNFAADVENPNWEAIIMRNADMTLVYSGSDMMQEEGSLRGDGKVKFWTDAQETVTDENGITSIPIAFDSSYHADARAWILRAITHLADRMGCIKFVQRNDQTRYIRFVDHASDGCQSYVGVMRDEIPTEVRLGGGCMQTRTIIHETLHALGYGHTSNRSDRDKHVRVIWENIEDQFLHAFEKSVDPSVPVTPYDCQNIMHLGSDSLNKLGSDTLRSIDGCHLETNWMRALQYGIQYRDSETIDKQMSQNDVVGAQEMYCPSRIVDNQQHYVTSTPTTPTTPTTPINFRLSGTKASNTKTPTTEAVAVCENDGNYGDFFCRLLLGIYEDCVADLMWPISDRIELICAGTCQRDGIRNCSD
eukprot:GHVH01008723.1.p1 GENE.GHVH01008723.1~~GHVH01008723.1.p1  ORF type:complete len:385 (+),score=46.63 GHVH01008723.1:79-1233(+)